MGSTGVRGGALGQGLVSRQDVIPTVPELRAHAGSRQCPSWPQPPVPTTEELTAVGVPGVAPRATRMALFSTLAVRCRRARQGL